RFRSAHAFPPFPTRRSSDLIRFGDIASIEQRGNASLVTLRSGRELLLSGTNDVNNSNRGIVVTEPTFGQARISWRNFDRLDLHRSEEHTSELQSRENLVCRL